MSHQKRIRYSFPPLVFAAVLLAAPAAADWLKTREGALVETRGGWKVKGSTVVFTAANGTLSSLRLSEVDLDASAVVTFESRERDEQTEEVVAPRVEAAREPVLVLTNKDIPRAGTVFEDAGAGEDETETGTSGKGTSEPVTVISWRPVDSEGAEGLELHGTLQNQGEHIASNIRLMVHLHDAGGQLLGSSYAFLEDSSLAPTSSVKFRALFPDVTESPVTPEFEVKSTAIQLEAVLVDTRDEGNES